MINTTIDRFTYLLDLVPALLHQIPMAELEEKKGANRWSKKEIIGHLIDSAANNHQRFIRSQYEHTPTIVYGQNQWNALNHYQSLEAGHVIALWTLYNRHLLEVIKRMPLEHLAKECNTGEEKPFTLQFLIEDYVVHMEHHLQQIITY